MRAMIVFAAGLLALGGFMPAAQAGLDLENQSEIRIQRAELSTYMYYYFDRDGNETLTSGEYSADRPITIIPYEGEDITFIDLDGDGEDDGVDYTTESFLAAVMAGDYEPESGEIEARDFIDSSFLRLDRDKSKAIEQKEWHKAYEKAAAVKPKQAPKAADQHRYSR